MRQWAMGNRQWAMGNGQQAASNWQWVMGIINRNFFETLII